MEQETKSLCKHEWAYMFAEPAGEMNQGIWNGRCTKCGKAITLTFPSVLRNGTYIVIAKIEK